MATYCQDELCAEFEPCQFHSIKIHNSLYKNEVAKYRADWVREYLVHIQGDCALIIHDYFMHNDDCVYYHIIIDDSELMRKAHAKIRFSNKQETRNVDVSKFPSYVKELGRLVTALCHHFRLKIADIIAEYTGVRHFDDMQVFSNLAEDVCRVPWIKVHRGFKQFHNKYSHTQLQKFLDFCPGWLNILEIYNQFFHGTYEGAQSLSSTAVQCVFDNAIMIQFCYPFKLLEHELGMLDFLNYFFDVTLNVLIVEETK